MKSAKKFLMVAGAFALAILLFAISAPKTAHAIVATLVQITNTASNPVPVDADNAARHAVRLTLSGNTDTFFRVLNDSSNAQPYTVPAGKRLVLEHVSLFAYPPAGKKVFAYWFNGFTFTAVPVVLQQPDVFGGGTNDGFESSIPVRDYIDAGNQVQFTISGPGNWGPIGFWNVHAVGYLIDCNGVC